MAPSHTRAGKHLFDTVHPSPSSPKECDDTGAPKWKGTSPRNPHQDRPHIPELPSIKTVDNTPSHYTDGLTHSVNHTDALLEELSKQITRCREDIHEDIQTQKDDHKKEQLRKKYETRIYQAEMQIAEQAAQLQHAAQNVANEVNRRQDAEKQALLQESAKNKLVEYVLDLEHRLGRRQDDDLHKLVREQQLVPAPIITGVRNIFDCAGKYPWTWFPEGVLESKLLEQTGIPYNIQVHILLTFHTRSHCKLV